MVDCVMRCLVHPKAVGESFNVGNERAVATTVGLAEACVRVLGSTSTISFVDRGGADVQLRVPTTVKGKELIDFVAKVGLEEGIRRTGAWFKAQGLVGSKA
jgi:UDP-glucose 4-epimerase